MKFTMRYREEWPLWSVQKRIFEELGQVWVELDDVPDLRSKGMAGLECLAEELRRLERLCVREGVVGWIASVEQANHSMQRLLTAIGATHYAQDHGYQYFQKVAGSPEIPVGAMAIFRQARKEAVCGHA